MIQYIECGDTSGPLIVFIHGGGVSGWMWKKQLEYFTNYHCLVPDLPGHGKSVNSTTFNIHTSATKIIELIEEKGNGKTVSVIGFSIGAQILIEMLSIKPNLMNYAIINSALVRPIPLARMWATSLKLFLPLINNRSFSRIQAKSMYIDANDFETYYQESRLMDKQLFVSIMLANMTYTLPANFKSASSKILVTVGEKEKSIMKKSLADIVKNNPNCKGLVIPKVGHGVSLANPDFFNKLVDDWIRSENIQ